MPESAWAQTDSIATSRSVSRAIEMYAELPSHAPSVEHVESRDSPCVLVVEDDPLTQARLEVMIEASGLVAVSVPSARQARAALAAVFFPIVIVDRILEDG